MPDIVNDDDLSQLAAEYVIGTLSPDEHTRANGLLDVDQSFRDLVRAWERRLGELHLMVEPVEPDARIWDRIRGRLGAPLSQALSPAAELKLKLEPSPEPAPEPKTPTTEQQLAELVREAEKFSQRQAAEIAADLAAAAPAETPAATGAKELLAEAAETITAAGKVEAAAELAKSELVKSELTQFEPTESEPAKIEPAKIELAEVGRAEPESAEVELRPAHEVIPRGSVVPLSPTEIMRGARRRVERERRAGGWMAAALFMTVVAAGLGALIAAWRFAPDRLPPPLRPMTVLGLTDASGQHRPVLHGTAFEE